MTEIATRAAPSTASARTYKGIVLALVCAAQAMTGIDTAVVNVALPSIQHDLGAGPGALQWVVVAYALLLGGFLLLAGRLADQLGRRRIMITGLAIFTAASLVSGLALRPELLIAARGVQGFGAALIGPSSVSMLATTFTEGRERNRALGLLGGIGGAAGAVGCVAGGLLTAGPGWRWAFFVNVPVGILIIALSFIFLAVDRSTVRSGRLDVAGAITVTSGLLVAVYAVHNASVHGWPAGSTLLLFAAAAGLLIIFVRIEARSADPLVPGSVIKVRSIVIANATALLAFGGLASFIFSGSLMMQQSLGYSPLMTAVAWLATTVTIVLVANVSSRFVAGIGVRTMLIIGLSLLTGGALWLTRTPVDAHYAVDLLPAFLCAAFGFGLCGPSLQIGALTGVSRSDTGVASGLMGTTIEIGGAAGVAIVTTALVSQPGMPGFHAAFRLTAIMAAIGVIITAFGFAGVDPAGRRSSVG